MKTFNKLLAGIFICFFLFSLNSSAQERTNVLKTNATYWLLQTSNITYEKVLNSKSSLTFSGYLPLYLFSDEDNEFKLFAVGGGYRHYLLNTKIDVPSGLWASPQINFLGFGWGGENSAFAVGFIAQADVGYQFSFRNGLTIDLGGGILFPFGGVSSEGTGVFSPGQIVPSIIVSLGYAF